MGRIKVRKESEFQRDLIRDIRERFPGSYVIKMDGNYIQGFPDLLILYNDKWGALEVKRDGKAKHRPNQDYHVSRLNDMSFASFIYPENKEEVLHDMEGALQSRR